MTGTNSDHSFGWKIVRRAGTVWTVDIGTPRSASDAQFLRAAQRLKSEAAHTAQLAAFRVGSTLPVLDCVSSTIRCG